MRVMRVMENWTRLSYCFGVFFVLASTKVSAHPGQHSQLQSRHHDLNDQTSTFPGDQESIQTDESQTNSLTSAEQSSPALFESILEQTLDEETHEARMTISCHRENEGLEEATKVTEDQKEEGDNEKRGSSRQKRYSLGKYGDGSLQAWRVKELTWAITKPTRQLEEGRQRAVIQWALDKWAKYVPIKFREISRHSQKEPDINIRFETGKHGPKSDPVFDGASDEYNALAHAWGPHPVPSGFPGDVHFDDGDDWSSIEQLKGTALHELGHVMGLFHSDDENAIMFPTYRDVYEIGQDDIEGIRVLYADAGRVRYTTPRPDRRHRTRRPNPRQRTPRPDPRYRTYPPPPPTPSPTPLDLCTDAKLQVFEDPSTKFTSFYFVTSGEQIHRINTQGDILQTVGLTYMFPGAPLDADVTFSIPEENSVYFIKGDRVWQFTDHKLQPGHPHSLRTAQFPETPRYSLKLHFDERRSPELLLFGNKYWWRFDTRSNRRSATTEIGSFSDSIPKDIDFAVRWMDNKIYAVSSDSYVILDGKTRRRESDKPIPGKPGWLKAVCAGNRSSGVRTSMSGVLLSLLAVFAIVTSSSRHTS